ncbi:MAG: ankyrin repeat domain-containing protein, partial [Gammaproteobacteria bacterium]|nr:ankyrin repeat domain-containing protein [Gammaproteobacteria bacterium]
VNAEAPLENNTSSSGQNAVMTPLLMASASGHEEIALCLLKKGADPNAWDGGAAPLHYALMEGISYFQFRDSMDQLVKELLAHGADPNTRFEKTIVKTRGYDTINMPGPGGTALLLAAATPDPDLMRLLLSHGADPNLKTHDNVTALMGVAGVIREQAYTETQIENGLEAAKILVDLGADVNASSDIGRTALHGATQVLANPLIQYLAEQGADVDARDIYQQTPLSAAMGVRLPWVRVNPLGEEGFVRQSTVDLLLSLGATPLETPGYFKPVEGAEEYRYVPR